MYLKSLLAALAASSSLLVSVAPPSDGVIHVEPDLRPIKTPESDPGTWVTEEGKIENYVAKIINFIDITEITDKMVLRCLSTTPKQDDGARAAVAAITYPTTLAHVAEANALIAKVNTTGPKCRPTATAQTRMLKTYLPCPFTLPPMIPKVFYFPPESPVALKTTVASYTMHDALCALIWEHMTLARNPISKETEKSSALLYSANIFHRTSPPLSPTYLGNASVASITPHIPIASFKSSSGLIAAASGIRNSLNAFKITSRIPLTIGLINSHPDATDHKLACNYFLGLNVITTSWVDVGVYKLKWGILGAPKGFRLPFEGADGVVSVFPRLENGGLEVMVGLETGAMERLMVDERFLDFAHRCGHKCTVVSPRC